jgi:hypothetical protein
MINHTLRKCRGEQNRQSRHYMTLAPQLPSIYCASPLRFNPSAIHLEWRVTPCLMGSYDINLVSWNGFPSDNILIQLEPHDHSGHLNCFFFITPFTISPNLNICPFKRQSPTLNQWLFCNGPNWVRSFFPLYVMIKMDPISKTLCILSIHQTTGEVQHTFCIMNQSLSQTFRDPLIAYNTGLKQCTHLNIILRFTNLPTNSISNEL